MEHTMHTVTDIIPYYAQNYESLENHPTYSYCISHYSSWEVFQFILKLLYYLLNGCLLLQSLCRNYHSAWLYRSTIYKVHMFNWGYRFKSAHGKGTDCNKLCHRSSWIRISMYIWVGRRTNTFQETGYSSHI